jgi:hypothetical protein
MPEKVTVQPLGQGTYTNDSYRSRWRDATISTPYSAVSQTPEQIHLTVNIGDETLIDRVIDAVDKDINV